MTSASSHARLRAVVEPVVAAAGYEVDDVSVTPAGRRRVLRVVVDRDGGVQLDDIADISTAVASALDASDVMGAAPYVLEVSSPGVDRPLTDPRRWRRARGRLVHAPLVGGGEVVGRLSAADDDGVTLATPAGERRLSYAEIGRGRVEVEFRRDAEQREEP